MHKAAIIGRMMTTGAHIHHMQQQVLLGNGLAPVVRAHRHHHRISIPVSGIRILESHSCPHYDIA